ncbi:glycosyl transferases group 1-domain-containing protein [Tirmania nivea]|nr:glycosyl transferases group 1-domain-containing protein [Tirmania nivea]
MDPVLEYATPILVTSLALSALLLLLPGRPKLTGTPPSSADPNHETRVIVLVLGDIGRSPRMQYHALSIARKGGKVDLVGYNDSPPRPELLASPSITIHPIPPPPRFLTTSSKALFPIFAPIKIALQLYHLLSILIYTVPHTALYMLLQNPPSMPTFLVAWFMSRLRGIKVVIDWHNFGWTILGQKLGEGAPIVGIAGLYEKFFGKLVGDVHFTVTYAMKDVLRNEFGITSSIHPLHDRPPTHFHSLTPAEKTTFLSTFPPTSTHLSPLLSGSTKLLVSSTSWTPDEDFQLLLTALTTYDRVASLSDFLSLSSTPAAITPSTDPAPKLPHLLLIITGKGPQKSHYEAEIQKLDFQHITIHTAWLEAEDYPILLACADLGVCLHTSSSGVDLPMKVVDLFGAGVPVAAVEFKALSELVKDGVNGVVFKDGEELGQRLISLFNDSKGGRELAVLKEGAEKEGGRRWDGEWDGIAGPVFRL